MAFYENRRRHRVQKCQSRKHLGDLKVRSGDQETRDLPRECAKARALFLRGW